MPRAIIDELTGGLAPDQVDYNLPDGVFSTGVNVRFRYSSAEKCKGNQAVFGSLSATAIWANSIGDGTTIYWIYECSGHFQFIRMSRYMSMHVHKSTLIPALIKYTQELEQRLARLEAQQRLH